MKQQISSALTQGDNTPVILKGIQEFMNKQIPVIVGGFGEDQKVVIDKMVAEIHNMEIRNVRARITDNIKRFKEGIDFIDLKEGAYQTSTLEILLNLGYTKSAITQAKHIYLLSERGYAKLIKIMDTDLAWEIHDKLIDEYFKLREQLRRLTPLEELRLQYQALEVHSKEIESVREEVTGVREEVTDLKDNMPLFNVECKELQALVRSKGVQVLGGYKSPAYNDPSLRGQVYSDIQRQIKREFGISKYEAIKRSQLEIARRIVDEYKAPTVLVTDISKLNNQMSLY